MNSRSASTTVFGHAAIVAVVLALGAGIAAAAPASAEVAPPSGDVTWGVRAGSNPDGTDRENFNYTLDPGEVLTDSLVVTNHDAEPLQLDVYPADGFTTTSGQLDVVTRDVESIEIGAWTAVDTDTIEIPAGESAQVPFTIAIPDDATPGDYAGGIVTSLPQATQEQGISVDRRLGVRMHVRVLGDLAPALVVEDMVVDYTGGFNPFGSGDATVSYTVHNTGNVRLAATQTVSLAGPFGLFGVEAKDVEDVPEVLPGESWTVEVQVDGVVPAFWLTASSVLVPELAVVAGATPGLESVTASTGTWSVPWALLVLALLVAAAIVAAIFWRRRRRRQQTLREEALVQEAVEQALRDREKTDAAV
ncbi:uncharacterized protein DUF916 [Glaciihabitans tibetensis]|uniref:Uncharacterized protein DUF916 n=1 Tax=Glaciihabitans tibetensis TaxID=1266600 RepID=A0A2T0VD94_9MICO|nr:DUF916 domain-containing protein [Glaciihabitans tibetensis]PRY68129.1 uncharacterized protein DUF916 [Glaciihabitans tibetensis]